jgi:hypothetical protein
MNLIPIMSAELPAAQNTRPWTFTLNNLVVPLSVYFSVSRGKRTEETILLHGLVLESANGIKMQSVF